MLPDFAKEGRVLDCGLHRGDTLRALGVSHNLSAELSELTGLVHKAEPPYRA